MADRITLDFGEFDANVATDVTLVVGEVPTGPLSVVVSEPGLTWDGTLAVTGTHNGVDWCSLNSAITAAGVFIINGLYHQINVAESAGGTGGRKIRVTMMYPSVTGR